VYDQMTIERWLLRCNLYWQEELATQLVNPEK
jgi:hypothetical protein